MPLTYIYSDQDSYDPLARIDGVEAPEIFWFHCQPNGTPERMTDIEGLMRWEGVNSAWGKLLRESETQLQDIPELGEPNKSVYEVRNAYHELRFI